MKLDSDEAGGVIGLFRASSLATRYEYAYGTYANSDWVELAWFVDGAHHRGKNAAEWNSLCRRITPMVADKWYKHEITVRGDAIACRTNAMKHFSYSDDTLRSGGVGFRTRGARLKFKNIKVVDPANRVLWDGLPELPE